MDSLIGQQLDKYTIISELGRGGMAVVFLAHDTEMDRDVAIKVLPREFSFERTFVERFQQEAKAIARLNHPHILPVFDYGQHEGWTFIAMTYMPGGSLADRIRQSGRGLPLDQISEWVSQIAGALDYAHSRGIIHRDFKPANVLIGDHDNVALSDFGIAKMTEATAQLTGSGIIGTPAYMAPEMARKGGISPQIDVYALGVTVYQMLTGQLPFDADTPLGLLMAHATEPVPDPRAIAPEIPDDVAFVIQRALAKNPAQRYPNARGLSDDLDAAIGGTLTQDFPVSTQAMDAGTIGVTNPHMEASPRTQAGQPVAAPRTLSGQSTSPRRGLNPIVIAGGLVGIAVIALGVLWASGVIAIGAASEPTPTQAASPTPLSEVTPTVTSAVTATSAVSLNPTAAVLFGTAQVQPAGSAAYEAMTGNRNLQAGDRIKTGAQSAVSLNFGAGVGLEMHAGTEVEVVNLTADGNTLIVELNQLSGAAYHFIEPPTDVVTVQYLLHAPDGVVTHTGTQYWSVLTRAGWCFAPTIGSILFQSGQADEDISNDHPANASNGESLLVQADGTITGCGSELDTLLVYTDGKGTLIVDPGILLAGAVTVTPGGATPTGTAGCSCQGVDYVCEASISYNNTQCGGSGLCGCRGDNNSTWACPDGTFATFNPKCIGGGDEPPSGCGKGGQNTLCAGQGSQPCLDNGCNLACTITVFFDNKGNSCFVRFDACSGC